MTSRNPAIAPMVVASGGTRSNELTNSANPIRHRPPSTARSERRFRPRTSAASCIHRRYAVGWAGAQDDQWSPNSLIEGDVAEGVRRLKSELDRDLISSGAGQFARFLVEQGLVDEVLFWVHRTIRGPGDRPFHEGDPIDFTLLGSRAFESGITLLRYRQAGRFSPRELSG